MKTEFRIDAFLNGERKNGTKFFADLTDERVLDNLNKIIVDSTRDVLKNFPDPIDLKPGEQITVRTIIRPFE
jgi:hypothetical protein